MIDVKMRTEEILRASGIAHTVFCPTWVSSFVKYIAVLVLLGHGAGTP